MSMINSIARQYFEFRYRKIEQFIEKPIETQEKLFRELIEEAARTEWGRKYGYGKLKGKEEFAKKVPISDYEQLLPYIKRMMEGEKDVLWPKQVKWYAKSSGTTSERSKYIPVSAVNLKHNHIKGSYDALAILYNATPRARVFADRSLIMGGSLEKYKPHPETTIGDISAVMLRNMPLIGRPFFAPDLETALLDDWEEKINRTAERVKDENITMFGGVPTWTIVLFRKLLEMTGKDHMLEVWPEAQLYMHGGVSFKPYREQFRNFFPGDQMMYQEIYNASEGFFAVQNDLEVDDMLLLLENGIYYEFIPEDQIGAERPVAVPLEGVEEGRSYALVISTNSGLWRYTPGDLVTFSSTDPYKIRITGRTNQFINVFGEEVMIANTDKAIGETCRQFAVGISDYTVGPIFLRGGEKGGHHWVVEFDEEPEDLDYFADTLDKVLQKVNSDYAAKRFHDMALGRLALTAVPQGTFREWMKSRGKLGGQNKVPRLSNDRKYVESVIEFAQGHNFGS